MEGCLTCALENPGVPKTGPPSLEYTLKEEDFQGGPGDPSDLFCDVKQMATHLEA